MNDDLVLAALLSSPAVALLGTDRAGTVTMWSAGAQQVLGWSEAQVLGEHESVLVPPDRLQELQLRERVVAGVAVPPLETARVAADGSLVPVEIHVLPVRDGEGLVVGTLMLLRDEIGQLHDAQGTLVGGIGVAVDVTDLVSAEREVRTNEARLEALLRHSGDLVLVVDGTGRLLWISAAVEGVLGLDPRQLFWRPVRELVHPDDLPALSAGWAESLDGRPLAALPTCRLRAADGSWRWFDVKLVDLRADPAVGGVVVNLRDQTERRAAEREAQRLAMHDVLTGLPNRALLLDRIGQALVWGGEQRRHSGVVALGVSAMTAVNEALGDEGGDLVLCSVAGRLLEVVRSTDSVARVGGDRFAVLIEDVASTEELRTRAGTLLDAVEGSVDLPGMDIDLRFRVGSAMTPAAGAGSLLSAAERSMTDSVTGDRSVAVAQGAVQEGAPVQAAADELRQAVARGELRLHFQPVMSLLDGSMVGAEALVRWQHPERGLLSPAEFVPVAESSGLILELGTWVLREACRSAARWQAAGHSLGVGLNLSPLQMVDRSFVDVVRDVLSETGARADLLVLEVRESSVLDVPAAADVLGELRGLGIKLALDDFGTGYSSLTYLRRFPVDTLKIDRSFVAGLGRNADDDAIVASVASLGRSVGKLVVAEGVETVGQIQALQALGVDQAQGFYWSPGLVEDELLDWWADSARRPVVPVPPAPAPAPTRARRRSSAEPASADVLEILRLHAEGASLHTIAAALNAEGKRTAEGRRWTTTTVARVVAAALGPA